MTIADNKHVFDFCEALTRVMRNIQMIQYYQGLQNAAPNYYHSGTAEQLAQQAV